MATRDIEGRREIEAAKQRLVAAKSHASFISKTEETAKKMLADIQLQATSSKKEVEQDAKKFLAEAEKRWEVITIDVDDESTPQKTSSKNKNKKRKVDAQLSQSNNTHSSSNQANDVNEIIVSGAGSAEFNGTYKRVPNRRNPRSDGFFPIFVMNKPGEKPEKFAIYHYQEIDHWWIGAWMKRSYPCTNKCYQSYYRSMC